MESSNTRGITRGIVSPLAPQAERGSGNSNATGNCSGELKSILRKKAMPSLPPSIRSTPLSTSPSESTSSLVSYTNNRGISPATLTSNPSVLCISPPAAVPTSQTISSLFSLSPIATPKSMGLSRSTSQSKHIGENRSPEDILAESGDLDTQKSTTSESEKDVDNTELPSNLNQSTESLLTYDDGQKEEGTNDDLYIFNQEEKKSRLKLVAVALEILPVSLDQFAAMFVEENAPFNMKKYVLAFITIIVTKYTCILMIRQVSVY